jgi:hypothetical protein
VNNTRRDAVVPSTTLRAACDGDNEFALRSPSADLLQSISMRVRATFVLARRTNSRAQHHYANCIARRCCKRSRSMSVQADFHSAIGMLQSIAVATWTWEMADTDRLMTYAVVPGQHNQEVSLTEPPRVSQDNRGRLIATLTVRLDPFDRGSSPPGLINFFAARIPPM